MRTFATKQLNQQDATHQKPVGANPAPVLRSHNVSPLSAGIPLLQRQCACGGGCPRCQEADLLQTKLKISEPSHSFTVKLAKTTNINRQTNNNGTRSWLIEHFKKELSKEIKGESLWESDKKYLKKLLLSGKVFMFTEPNPGLLTGKPEHDLPILAQYFLCEWSSRRLLSNEPPLHLDPLFCFFSEATAEIIKSDCKDFTDKILQKAFKEVSEELVTKGLMNQQSNQLNIVRPDHTKGFKGQTEAITFAMNLQEEAGIEFPRYGIDSLRAVAQVVLNRKKRGFPGSNLKNIILAKNQFSWTLSKTAQQRALNPPKKDQEDLWRNCLIVTDEALSGNMPVLEATKDATYYFNPQKANPIWRDDCCFVGKVGNHCFYNIEIGQKCNMRGNRSGGGCQAPRNQGKCEEISP